METLIALIDNISIGSALLSLIIYFYLKRYSSRAINLLACLLLASIISDCLSIILFKVFHTGNIIINNIYNFLQFTIVSLIYYHIYLKKQGSFRLLIISFGVVFTLLNIFFWQGVDTFQNINRVVTSLFIITMAFGHTLYMNRFPVSHINQYAPYWITTGLLFYFTFSFAIFALSKFFIEDLKLDADFRYVWMFHNLNNIFKNGCFFLAIWWSAYRDPAWDEPQTLKTRY